MAQEQAADSNLTERAEPEQPNRLALAVMALKERTRQALSPWVQRQLDRARTRPAGRQSVEPYERTAVSGSHTLSLVNHLQRAVERTVVWRPSVGSLSPTMVQRFARTVADRVQPPELIGTKAQPRQPITGWGDDLDLILPTGPGAAAAATGDLAVGSRIRGPSVFSVGQRIPPMTSKSSPGPRVPRVSTRQAPRRPQRKPLPRDARLFSHIMEVGPDKPAVPEPDLSVGISADEEAEADEQEMTSRPAAAPGPPQVPQQVESAPARASSGPPRPPSAPGQKAAPRPRVQRQAAPSPPARPRGQERAEGTQPASELAAFFAAPRPAEPDRPAAPEPTETALPEREEAVDVQRQAKADPGPEPASRPTVQRRTAPETPLRASPTTPGPKIPPKRRPPTRQADKALPGRPQDEAADQPVEAPGTAPAEPRPPGRQEVPRTEIQRAGEETPRQTSPARGQRLGTRPPSVQRQAEPAVDGKASPSETEPVGGRLDQGTSLPERPFPGPAPAETEAAAEPGEPRTVAPAGMGTEPAPPAEGELEMPLRLPPSIQAAPDEVTAPPQQAETGQAQPPEERAREHPAPQAAVQRQQRPPAGEQATPPAPAPRAAAPDAQHREPAEQRPFTTDDKMVAVPDTQSREQPPVPGQAPPEERAREHPAPQATVQRQQRPPAEEQVTPPAPAPRAVAPDAQRREQPLSEDQPPVDDVSSPLPGEPAAVQRAPEPASPPPRPEPSLSENLPPSEEQRPEWPAMPLRIGPHRGEAKTPTTAGPEATPHPIQRETKGPPRPKTSQPDAPPMRGEKIAAEPSSEHRDIAQVPAEPPPVEMPPREAARRQEMPAPERTEPTLQRPVTPARDATVDKGLNGDLWARAISHVQMPLSHLAAPSALRPGGVQRQPHTGEPAGLPLGPAGWSLVRGPGAIKHRSLSPALFPRTPERYIGPDLSLPVSSPTARRRVQRSPVSGPAARPKPPSPADLMQAFLATWPAEDEGQMVLPPPPRPAVSPGPARAAQAQPQARRPTPTSLSPSQHRAQQPPASPLIQRQAAVEGTLAADQIAPVRGTIVQRAADKEEEEKEGEKVDLTTLARLVYPFVKRMLAVERERRPHW